MWMEFLYGCGFFLDLLFIVAPTLTPPQQGLLSTKSIEDLLLVNPFLSLSSAEEVLRITFVFIYPFERMNGSCARLFISLKEREEGRKEGRFSRRFIDTDASIDRWGGGCALPVIPVPPPPPTSRALILRSNRIGSSSRCVAASISLLELIESALSLKRGEERERAKATT